MLCFNMQINSALEDTLFIVNMQANSAQGEKLYINMQINSALKEK